jgi:signal transduction histidine kinase/ligand-binding sensor domain-containing protein
MPVLAVTSIREDRGGRIWASTGNGLTVAEGGTLRRYFLDGKPLLGVAGVQESHDGGLWLRTRDGLRRLENGALQNNKLVGGIRAATLHEDSAGNLWIGTLGEGLTRFSAAGLTSYQGPAVLPSNAVWSIFEDREQNLWIGTHNGLVRFGKTTVRSLGEADGLVDDNVSSVYEDRQGVLWLTTITGQVYRFTAGKVAPFRLPPKFANVQVRTVFVDSHGVLWIGTGSDGVIRISNGVVTLFTTVEGLRNNSIRQFFEDRHGDLWIALGSGLSRWDGRRFQNYYLEDGLPYGSVRVVMQRNDGDIIVGTDGGLSRIHDGKFVPDPAFAPLNGEKIWAIHEDADRTLWAGTRGGGLFRIKDRKAARLTVRDGLLSNAIFQILADGSDNLWLSGPAGVFSAPRNELNRVADGTPGPIAIVPHGSADGMESSHMNGAFGWAGWRTASGHLWFASVKGAVRIDPNQIRITSPSPVVIENVLSDDKPVQLSREIHVAPGHGKLEIDYTACSLLAPERISFRYKLENFDENWLTASNRRAAYYTNLPPGRYKFRVIATDSAMPRQASEASTMFVLEPHAYQTNWFYGLCAALLAACVWLAMRFYARQTRARYALLLAERTRLAREMHDTVIQGCVGVSTLLEAASGFSPTNMGRVKELLDQARVQVRVTLDEAREAVWDLRNAHIEGDICGALPVFARQISLEKGIPIDVETTGTPEPLDQGMIRSLLLVAREAIRNASAHGNPRKIRIRLSFEPNEVRLEVIDDGRGFAPDADALVVNRHYGILGMRERVEQLGGIFSLNSRPGQGAAVVARLPLGRHRLEAEVERTSDAQV